MSTGRKQPVAGRCADGKRRCQGTHPLICETHGCAILEGRAAAVELKKRADAEREALAAARGWAALEKTVRGLLAQARRRRVQAAMGRDENSECFYEGRRAALEDVMALMEAEKTAPPIDALCESAGREKTFISEGDVAAPSDSQQQLAMPPSVGNAHNNKTKKMKLKQLITELLDCDMDAEVSIHAQNGTHLLPVVWVNPCTERTVGDTDEPRVYLCGYEMQPCAEQPKA